MTQDIVEGDTDDPKVLDIRFRMMKNFIATLAFSQGVPMMAHGDEVARTQKGNNNAYAQDNEITWMNWTLDERRKDLLEFTRKVFAIRQANPVLRRRHFFSGEQVHEDGHKDLTWYRPDGREMEHHDWHDGRQVIGMLVHGASTDETDLRGRPILGETMLMLLNGGGDEVKFKLPVLDEAGVWVHLLDTARPEHHLIDAGYVSLAPHSMQLLRHGYDRRKLSDGTVAAVVSSVTEAIAPRAFAAQQAAVEANSPSGGKTE